MKRKYSIGSFLFGLIVLFAILLQSVHSYHHLEKVFAKEKCHHEYSKNDSQITHSHELENCFACEFTFSNSIKKEFLTYNFKRVITSPLYSIIKSREIIRFFSGAIFALRAPPTI